MSEISVAVGRLAETNNVLTVDMKKLAGMNAMVEDILETTKALQSGDTNRSDHSDPVRSLSLAISSLSVQGQTLTYDRALLAGLHFPTIQTRHENIETAHAKTFEWIFQREPRTPDLSPIGFVEWLEQSNGVFWIHGKPGCGKSTLLKFICHHPQTLKHLGHWTENHAKFCEKLRLAPEDGTNPATTDGTRLSYEADLVNSYHGMRGGGKVDGEPEYAKLVTSKYFFWNTGSALQRSQEGLLRSLLFEVLRQCPEMISHVRRTRCRYRGYSTHPEDTRNLAAAESWSVEELLATLQDAINTRVSATFFLVVDGLDEYKEENRHTHRDLANTLHLIAQAPNVKICASSRPWTVFLDVFQNMAANSLKMDDLTREDMRRFIRDKFEAHEQFQRLCAHDANYAALTEEVVKRSQGVFLWVSLAVKSLLEGLTHHDSVQTLQQRLAQFPPDLEGFFSLMIDSIPTVYRRQSARTFLIALEAGIPMFLTVFSFFDDIEADPEFCRTRPQAPMDEAELTARHERIRRQLDGQTKGLLEVVARNDEGLYFTCEVHFLHRTVREFLRSSSKAQAFMTSGRQNVSEICVLACRGLLAGIRYAPYGYGASHHLPNGNVESSADLHYNNFPFLANLLSSFAIFSTKALSAANNEGTVFSLFKSVQAAERQHLDGFNSSRPGHANLEPYLPLSLCTNNGYPALLPQADYDWTHFCNLRWYPHETLFESALTPHYGAEWSQPLIIRHLLAHGGDPNLISDVTRMSPFQLYLDWIYPVIHQPGMDKIAFEIVGMLVAHGADLSAVVEGQRDRNGNRLRHHYESMTATAMIRTLFPPDKADQILAGAPPPGNKAQQAQQPPSTPKEPSSATPLQPDPTTPKASTPDSPTSISKPTLNPPSRGFRAALRDLSRRHFAGRKREDLTASQ